MKSSTCSKRSQIKVLTRNLFSYMLIIHRVESARYIVITVQLSLLRIFHFDYWQDGPSLRTRTLWCINHAIFTSRMPTLFGQCLEFIEIRWQKPISASVCLLLNLSPQQGASLPNDFITFLANDVMFDFSLRFILFFRFNEVVLPQTKPICILFEFGMGHITSHPFEKPIFQNRIMTGIFFHRLKQLLVILKSLLHDQKSQSRNSGKLELG